MLSILSMTNSEVTEDHTLQMHGAALHDHLMHDNDEDDDVNDDMHDHDNSALSKAEIRKSNKPIMEKRRRARINTCLNELKSLILDALKKDPSRHSKLEKADILEMTVKHLQAVQRQQLALAVAHDPSVLGKFKGGFGECAQEITRYISRIEGVDSGVRQRLMQHLSNCTNSLNTTTPLTFTAMAGLPMPLHHPQPPQHGDLNNNQARLLHRFVATRLAAAGDTAGAALILNGGLSLFARGGHPSPHGQPPLPPPPPQNPLPRPVKIVNSRACPSSSGDLSSSIRASAFTAVKRIPNSTGGGLADPTLQANKGPHQYKVLAPTALRPVICSDGPMKTMVQAQVALKPMALFAGDESHSPLDFSFRRSSIGSKRPLEDQPPFPLPEKMIKTEDGSSPASTSHLHSLHRLSQSTGPLPNTSQSAGLHPNTTPQSAGLFPKSSPQSAGLLPNSSPQSAGLNPNTSPQSAGLLSNTSPQSAGLFPNTSPQSAGPYSIHLSPQSTGSQLQIPLSPQSAGPQDIIPLSLQSVGQPSIQNSPPSTSKSAPHVVAQKIGNPQANKIEMREESPNNSIDGEDKDMWRPW